MRPHALIPLLIFLASAQAMAQGSANRGELFAGGGVSRVGGDEGSLGSGAYVFGGAGFRLAPRLSIEVDAMRAAHERDIAGGPLEGTATGVFGSVAYHFLEGPTQIFFMGSAGVLRSQTTHTFPFAGTTPTFTSDATSFAWGGGGGVKFFVTTRFSLRPQVRVVFSEATGVSGLLAASIGIGYHW